jgi:hypothetical protein
MQRVSFRRRLSQCWLLLVAAAVVAVATITYLDVNAQPQRAGGVMQPWAHDTTATQPAVFVNVAAQGNSNFPYRLDKSG